MLIASMTSGAKLSARRGVTAVESALVLTLLIVLLMGIVVCGWMVFRHQQVAGLAREAARYASVRAGDYQRCTAKESPTKQQILVSAVLPCLAGIDPAALTITVTVIDAATGVETDWDVSPKNTRSITPGGEYASNTVRVTVSCRGSLVLFGDDFTVLSRCDMPLNH
jgi:Flp pilus assembly protein TadG